MATAAERAEPKLDGVQLAIMSNRFESIARTMMNTIIRTGRSRVLNTSRDCSCVILTKDCELVTAADSIPIHVTGGPDLMAKVMLEFHPDLRRGDAFFHNSPYHGNSHAADHSILVPVIDDAGTHHFTVFSKAHQADCGNAWPTTYMGAARDVYAEGALIFPAVKVQENYQDCADIVRMCEMRMRVPEQWWGDYLALLGAARIGERRVLEFAREVGWGSLHRFARDWFDYSEERMAEAIRDLPATELEDSTAHDPMPGVPNGIPINVKVRVDPGDARIDVDLRDNIDCQPCGLNLSEATARSSAMIGVLNSLDPSIPANAGAFRRIFVHLRDNCVVGVPRHPASCSAATTNVADRLINVVQRTMARLGEGVGLAEAGPSLPVPLAVISGHDPRADDAPFVNELMLPSGTGGPGGPVADGWLPFLSAGNAGTALRDSVEIDELSFPMLIHAQRLVEDSEGAGRHRGAPAAYLEFGPIDTALEVICVFDGTVNPAEGARGGRAGAPGTVAKRETTGELTSLDPFLHVVLEPGQTIVATSCGGGGYGAPKSRDHGAVRHDLDEGYISPQRAREVYGLPADQVRDRQIR